MEDNHEGVIIGRMQDGRVVRVKHVNHLLVAEFIEFICGFLWNVFIVLIVWNFSTRMNNGAHQLIYAMGSGPDSVVNTGDLMIFAGISPSANIGSYIDVDDIVVVKDKTRSSNNYIQKVTDVYVPIDPRKENPLVQINYQRKHSDPLEKKWFAQKDVVGKVVFVLPYGGMIPYIVNMYPWYTLIAVVILAWQPWLYIQAGTLFTSLLQKIYLGPPLLPAVVFAVVFLNQAPLVT